MAVATRYENVSVLADTNTFNGPGRCRFLLVGGSVDATLSITVGGNEVIALAAKAGESESTPTFIKFGGGVEATVTLAGTGAKAFAIWE